MNELIKLNNTTIGEQEVNTVSARDLHKFLGVTERFSSWRNPHTEELQVSIKTVMYQKGIDWLDRKLRTEGYKRNERPQDFL